MTPFLSPESWLLPTLSDLEAALIVPLTQVTSRLDLAPAYSVQQGLHPVLFLCKCVDTARVFKRLSSLLDLSYQLSLCLVRAWTLFCSVGLFA